MKFSYRLLKKLAPQIKPPKQLAELLTARLFETEALNNNTLEIDVLPNRYSDAASHWGIVAEVSGVASKKAKQFKVKVKKSFEVLVKTAKCNRLAARYFEGIKISPSPKWMQEILKDCGIQPINNLVDITNYVTLETGQPLHAFDSDKMDGAALIVRPAKNSEEVEVLDGKKYKLDPSDIVLADKETALDIAGIKGGKKAEITKATKNILLTAGSFDGISIYKTSRKINLLTDASLRFSHDISPELVEWGINKATELIQELCGGKMGVLTDTYLKKPTKRLIKFDINKFNKISGLNLKEKEAFASLGRLGFIVKNKLVEPPLIRTDIKVFEDLVEEVTRLYGYEKLSPQAPVIFLKPSGYEEQILLKDNVRKILTGFGLDEVYNYSFVGERGDGAIEVENPTSSSYAYLRPSLSANLLKNIKDNHRFFDRVAIFEIGKVFKPGERLMLGIAIADKKETTFFELKGLTEQLFQQLGLVDYFTREKKEGVLQLESDHNNLGRIHHQKDGKLSFAEIDLETLLKLVEGEKAYEPLSKYPSIMRDISLLVPQDKRFSEIMSLIERTAPKYLEDVDLIDFYEDKTFGYGNRSLTLRLIFLSNQRTLTDKEVDKEIAKITSALVDKLGAEVR